MRIDTVTASHNGPDRESVKSARLETSVSRNGRLMMKSLPVGSVTFVALSRNRLV